MAKVKVKEILPPRTRAKTPIAILKAVVKAIRAEPRRYDQGDWLDVWKPGDDVRRGWPKPATMPTCGTVGCVAGWVATLTRPKRERYPRHSTVLKRAIRALRLEDWQAGELFEGQAVAGTPGTAAYVEAGVQHIEAFMRKHLDYTGPKL